MERMRSTVLLAVVVVVASGGSAGAQVSGGGFTCSAFVAVPPIVRLQGLSELVGDIIIQCTGGAPVPAGAVVPTTNITVSLPTNVTSRLLGPGSNVSEALLLIDEPQPGSQVFCPSDDTGCAGLPAGSGNMVKGQVFGNQAVFPGVPVNPPGANVYRVYRITNVRANAFGVAGPGVIPLFAIIAASGNVNFPISNPFQLVGFVRNALSEPTIAPASLRQCVVHPVSPSPDSGSSMTFAAAVDIKVSELFATAFRPRDSAGDQNQPGFIHNTESGFYADATASLPDGIGKRADYATRVKLVFNNVPSGVSVWVDQNGFKSGVRDPLVTLTASETGLYSPVTPDDGHLAEVPLSFGSGTAVFEVQDSVPYLIDSLTFKVYVSYVPDFPDGSPAPGTGLVNVSFAPTPPAFFIRAGSSASATLPLPRFADTSVQRALFTVAACDCQPDSACCTGEGFFYPDATRCQPDDCASEVCVHGTCTPATFVTVGQGGWATSCSGTNWGCVLQSAWDAAYPAGQLLVGGVYTLLFDSAAAVRAFLPSGGTPAMLTRSYVDPTRKQPADTLAGQVLALRLSLDLDALGLLGRSAYAPALAELVYDVPGPFAAATVGALEQLGEQVLGGDASNLPAGVDVAALTTVLTQINEDYDGTDLGYLCPPPPP
jgi:hypothetical protein